MDCSLLGKIFGVRVAEVVSIHDVAVWLDENYGTPDADEFLAEFALLGGRR